MRLIKRSEDILFTDLIDKGQDAGLNIGGQLSVGSVLTPKESVFGAGDSYPTGENGSVAFHCDIADTNITTITNATDITQILGSYSGSSIGLFGGTTTGKYVLLGSDYPYPGVKTSIITKGIINSDSVVSEFMPVSGIWSKINFMASQANFPYTQLNRNAGITADNTREQWRFGFDPLNIPANWNKVTFSINGVNYNKYWGRFLLTGDITQDIIIENVKLHTNRTEINADGLMEYFGNSRIKRDLNMNWGNTVQLSGFSPGNNSVYFANGLGLGLTDNKFINGATDGRGGNIIMPEGIDTSIPLIFEFTWLPLSNVSGDVVFDIQTVEKKIGEALDNTEISLSHQVIPNIPLNSKNVLIRTQVLVDIESLGVGEMLAFSFKRYGSDAADTYTGAISFVNVRVVGHFWKN